MAGVYTDNQPDFSFLMPGETKTFSQYWYPIREIGPADLANTQAACSIQVNRDHARIGINSTSPREINATLRAKGETIWRETIQIGPDQPFVKENLQLPLGVSKADLELTLQAGEQTILKFTAASNRTADAPVAATEPAAPEEISSADELFTIGLHLEQYRHATRSPEPYWREAVRRDPLDSRCNNALGRWHLKRGEFEKAETHFRAAITRLTSRNPNPYDGEPFYNLGLTLRFLGRDGEAYSAFYKATWNAAWRAPAFYALAELDCREQRWESALDHLDRSLAAERDHLNARDLMVMVLRKLDRAEEADAIARQTLKIDPLDFWARWLIDEPMSCDAQVKLDLSLNLANAGFFDEALRMLRDVSADPAGEARCRWCIITEDISVNGSEIRRLPCSILLKRRTRGRTIASRRASMKSKSCKQRSKRIHRMHTLLICWEIFTTIEDAGLMRLRSGNWRAS